MVEHLLDVDQVPHNLVYQGKQITYQSVCQFNKHILPMFFELVNINTYMITEIRPINYIKNCRRT